VAECPGGMVKVCDANAALAGAKKPTRRGLVRAPMLARFPTKSTRPNETDTGNVEPLERGRVEILVPGGRC